VHIVDGITPVVFIVPTKTAETHANVYPWNLNGKKNITNINNITMLSQP